MAKHELWELKQMQSMPLELKVKMTQRRIKEWYDHYDGEVYVAFSGGKDSTVLKHIVDEMYDDVPSVFVNTGLEYPEIQKFAMSQKNVTTLRPKMSFKDVLTKYGYPVISKEVSKCVFYARKSGEDNVHYKKLFGTLIKTDREEIDGQMNIADYLGFNEKDLLEMSKLKRTGCIFCMFGVHLEKEPNRFQLLKQTHPKQYKYCIGGVR